MPEIRIVVAFLTITALGCASRDSVERTAWPQSRVDELLQRGTEDQAVRAPLMSGAQSASAPDSSLMARMATVDSANAAWLKIAVAAHGWPEPGVVGAEAASAAFLIVQHAVHDTAFQAAMLHEIVAAFERGEADGQRVALLSDRLAVKRGQPQVYGTQFSMRDGRLVPDAIEDSAGLDARRARMGMIPFADYVRAMDSLYGARAQP